MHSEYNTIQYNLFDAQQVTQKGNYYNLTIKVELEATHPKKHHNNQPSTGASMRSDFGEEFSSGPSISLARQDTNKRKRVSVWIDKDLSQAPAQGKPQDGEVSELLHRRQRTC